MDRREHSFLSIPLKPKIFHFPQNWEEWEEMKLDLINLFAKISKIPLYIQPFILK